MLMLKNEVKDLFKKAKLDEFTVGRDGAGFLNIVGPCGKPLVPITNFSIGSKLTKAEREICIDDHIQPVLKAHTKTILDLIDAKNKEKTLLEAANKMIDSFKDDEHEVGFSINNMYGAFDPKIDLYNGTVSKRVKTDKSTIFAKVIFASRDESYSIETYIDDIANAPKAAKFSQECKKIHDKCNALFLDYINARYEVKQAAEKLRVECSI